MDSLEGAQLHVGAAMIVIRRMENLEFEVLLGKRKNSSGKGMYAPPGGKIELEEDPKMAAVRELREETGIIIPDFDVERIGIEFATNNLIDGKYWITLFYSYAPHRVRHLELNKYLEPKLLEPDKCEFWSYFPVKELPQPLFPPFFEFRNIVGWK